MANNKIKKVSIATFCQCEMCKVFFEVQGKRSKFCGRVCRDKDSYARKKERRASV